jgi:putative transposase
VQRTATLVGAAHRNIPKTKITLYLCIPIQTTTAMANTYTQFYVHLVFTPKNKEALIMKTWKSELEKYITGIVQNHGHKMLAICCMPDHIHIFIGYNVNQLIPDLVEKIKTSSNAWIKNNQLTNRKFEWQRGYGAFSHSRAQLETVINYILNQEEHHRKKTFRDEYLEILKQNEVEYKDEYLFEFF